MKSIDKSQHARTLGKAGLTIAVVTALGLPLVSHAGSFQLPTDNAAGWGRAWAGGSLFPNDPTAGYNNPAAMAFITAPMIQVTGTGIRASSKFNGSFTDASGQPVSGGNPNGFGKFAPFPNIAWVAPINDRFAIGGGLSVPYGLISKYNSSWQGRYFGTKTSIQSIALSLSASFKVNDEFSIGAGIVGQHTKAQLNSVLDPAGSAYALAQKVGLPGSVGEAIAGGAPQSMDEQLNINVKEKTAFGWFGGFVFKPTAQDTFDVSYHSRIKQALRGHYVIYGGAQGKAVLAEAPTLGNALHFPLPTLDVTGKADASAQLNLPAFASVDWVHAFTDRFSLAATAQWTDWSSFKTLSLTSDGSALVSLPQNYKDTWTYSIGGDYKVNEQWTLRGGVGYDQTPSRTATRDPRLPDGRRRFVAAGIGYQPTDHFGFDLAYQHQFVGKVRVDQTNPIPLGAASMDGKIDDHGDIVSLTGTYKF